MLEESVALEQIELIAKFGCSSICTERELQTAIALILEITQDTQYRIRLRNKKATQKWPETTQSQER